MPIAVDKTAFAEPGKHMTIDLGDGVAMEFVWIEALKAWVGKYEVTNREFRRFRKSHDSGKDFNDDNQPVVKVSCGDAVAFAEWLDHKAMGLPTGSVARLPSGREWQTFARCSDGRKYPWGNEWPPKYGNSGKIDGYRDGYEETCPVEKSGKNDWGLYGVGGNVSEWTTDRLVICHYLRGGSWGTYRSGDLLSSGRSDGVPGHRLGNCGFRVVASGR